MRRAGVSYNLIATVNRRLKASAWHPSTAYRPVVDWGRGIFGNSNLSVLRTARGPAVLVEAGVIVNPAEEATLSDPAVVETQSMAIAAGLKQCISE